MTDPITIRMGGYGPPTTGFSRALKLIGDTLAAEFGDRDRREVCLEHHGFRLSRRRHPLAGRRRRAHARLPVVELSDRPRARAWLRRSAVPVRAARPGARRDGRRARPLSRRQDRSARELSHPRLVRERFSPDLEPPAHRAHAAGPQGHAHPRAAERGPGAHLRAARLRPAAHGSDRGDRSDQGRHHRRAGEPVRQHGDLRRAQVSPLPHRDQPLLHFAADFFASPGLRRLAAGLAARHARRDRARRRIPARAGHRGRPRRRAPRSSPRVARSPN